MARTRLAEIYASEKARGGGIASTLGKRALEKIDPRRVFNREGFLAAILPSLFRSYDATEGKVKKNTRPSILPPITPTPSVETASTAVLSDELKIISTNTKISAKNSMVLPSMARDTNITRQNIAKLLKLQGGAPTYKADMFFKRSSEREADYESKFKKTETTSQTTPTKDSEQKEKGGVFSWLKSLPTMVDLGGLFSTLANGLIKGGLITGILAAIGKYFRDEEFRTSVNNTVNSLLTGIFDIVKSIFDVFLGTKNGTQSTVATTTSEATNDSRREFERKKEDAKKNIDLLLGWIPGVDTKAELKQDLQQLQYEATHARTESTKASARFRQANMAVDLIEKGHEDIVDRGVITDSISRLGEAIKLYPEKSEMWDFYNRKIEILTEALNRKSEADKTPSTPMSVSPTQSPQTQPQPQVGVSPSTPMSVSPTQSPQTQPQPQVGVSPTRTATNIQTGPNGEFNNKQDFLTKMYPLAVKASEQLGGVDPNALLTHWGLESGWGTKPSGKFNYFGIKADSRWNGRQVDQMTHEVIGGERVLVPQPFRSYSSPDEAVNDYVSFLKTNNRYSEAGVLQARTSADFFNSLQRAGYATDPDYAAKLTGISNSTASQTASLAPAPSMEVASTRPSTSQMVAAATDDFERERMQLSFAPPVIISAPTTNNVQSPGRSQQTIIQPTVVDTEFMKLLVGRTVSV